MLGLQQGSSVSTPGMFPCPYILAFPCAETLGIFFRAHRVEGSTKDAPSLPSVAGMLAWLCKYREAAPFKLQLNAQTGEQFASLYFAVSGFVRCGFPNCHTSTPAGPSQFQGSNRLPNTRGRELSASRRGTSNSLRVWGPDRSGGKVQSGLDAHQC